MQSVNEVQVNVISDDESGQWVLGNVVCVKHSLIWSALWWLNRALQLVTVTQLFSTQ